MADRDRFKPAFQTHERVQKIFKGKSRTKQSEAAACDINNIMKHFEATGQVNHLQRFDPKYGDFTNVDNFQDAQNKVRNAESAFENLPSRIRNRFNNDPRELIAFMEDQENFDEAVELGLVDKPEEEKPAKAAEAAIPLETDPKDPENKPEAITGGE